jgi:hypothetical protein
MPSDPELPADRALILELAAAVGWQGWPATGDILLEVGDFEDTRLLAERDGLHLVEASSRGHRSVRASFARPRDARRMMVLELADAHRWDRRMPPVRHPGPAPGTELDQDHRLRWSGGEARFRPGYVGGQDAVSFSWVAGADPAVIAASYRHLNGEPLFDLGIRYETRFVEPTRPPGGPLPPSANRG